MRNMPEKGKKQSITFYTGDLAALEKLAAKRGSNISELTREFVRKGLALESSKEEVDLIASIIRQELTDVYQISDIKEIMDHDTDRVAKMLMKIGKLNGAMFFLLLKVFMGMLNEGSRADFEHMLQESINLGVDYMQKKDFQINSFLQDTGNLMEKAEKL